MVDDKLGLSENPNEISPVIWQTSGSSSAGSNMRLAAAKAGLERIQWSYVR